MDCQLAAARSHHLAVELAIAAGEGIPQWIFTPPPAGLGLRRLDFEMTYHIGTEPCHEVSMPPPWDTGYQEAFADMLAQLSGHLRVSGYDRDVTVIKLTGINTLTEELALPNESPTESGSPNPCVTDSPRIWAAAGYRPSLVATAMGGIAASYQRSFPNTLVTLAIITLFAFPHRQGWTPGATPASGVHQRSPSRCLSDCGGAAAARAPGGAGLLPYRRLAGRSANRGPGAHQRPPRRLADQHLVRQVREGAACAGPGSGLLQRMQNAIRCSEPAFLRMLHNGMSPQSGSGASKNGLFIEVFPSGVVAFPRAIKTAHDERRR
jgi:hypothetical protein